MMYVTDRKLAERYAVSRGTIWAWVKEGRLPPPVKLSPRCTRWELAEIEEWDKKRPRAEAGQ